MVGVNGGARLTDAETGDEAQGLSDSSLDEFRPVTVAKHGLVTVAKPDGAVPGRAVAERDVPRW